MKKNRNKTLFIVLVVMLLITLLSFGIFWLDFIDAFGINKNKMITYYENNDNYYNATGTIQEVTLAENDGYLRISEIEYDRDVYGWDPCYYVVRYSNAVILWDKWTPEVGMKISFTSADKIFYDGYTRPIVSIGYENNIILDFETGKEKLLEWVNHN